MDNNQLNLLMGEIYLKDNQQRYCQERLRKETIGSLLCLMVKT